MKNYIYAAKDILYTGQHKEDRTGTGTISKFARQERYDLSDNKLPMVTTKKLVVRSIIHELIWFLKGESNIQYLKDNSVKIWDAWADENGELGPVYGVQWRSWDDTRIIDSEKWEKSKERFIAAGFEIVGNDYDRMKVVIQRKIDQIADVINQLKNNPDSRRMIITAWNPSYVDEQALPPCHSFMQFYTRELTTDERIDLYEKKTGFRASRIDAKRKDFNSELEAAGIPLRALSCQLYQRSGDWFLGIPFNIVSYSLLTHMIAHVVGMVAEEFVHTVGDAHVYSNHLDAFTEQFENEPLEQTATVKFNPNVKSIDDFAFEDIEISDYKHYQFIKAPVAV